MNVRTPFLRSSLYAFFHDVLNILFAAIYVQELDIIYLVVKKLLVKELRVNAIRETEGTVYKSARQFV